MAFKIESIHHPPHSIDPYTIQPESLSFVLRGGKQLMLYGFAGCGWMRILKELHHRSDKIHVLSTELGYLPSKAVTREGRVIKKITVELVPDNPSRTNKRLMKAALVNLVYENYRRALEGTLPLIPIIFVVDITNNPTPFIAPNAASKQPSLNKLCTHAEIRRAYKLCTDKTLPPQLRSIAQKTFQFVKVVLPTKGSFYAFERLDPPWQHPSWQVAWKARKALSVNKQTDAQWKKEIGRLEQERLALRDCVKKIPVL